MIGKLNLLKSSKIRNPRRSKAMCTNGRRIDKYIESFWSGWLLSSWFIGLVISIRRIIGLGKWEFKYSKLTWNNEN